MDTRVQSLDHKRLMASLSDTQRLELTTKSDAKGLANLLAHVCAIVTTACWVQFELFAWQLALIAHGVQLVFVFTLLHETVHDTPFASKHINLWIGRICAFIIFLPPLWFRYFHLAHHRHTHDPENDPELQTKPVETLGQYIWHVSGLPVWVSQFKTLFQNAIGQLAYDYVPERARQKIVNEARLMMVAYVTAIIVGLALFGWQPIIYLWLLPLLLGQPFLRLYLLAEHKDCPHSDNMFENTRTIYTSMPVRWLAWNMPYHAEHHAFPNVPFHKLPEFHRVANAHLRTTENGYSRFHTKTIQLLRRGSRNVE